MITENLSALTIHKLKQEQYDRELAAGRIDENALYVTPYEVVPDEQINAAVNAYLDENPVDAGIQPPETATVGQTIVVKAVDENGKPTEWEAADLPSGGGAKATKLITVADITAETDIILSNDDTDDLYFGDAVIAHNHFFYKTPEGEQLRAKRIYGYIYTPTAITLSTGLAISAYYRDGTPNSWNFGDYIGNNTGFQHLKAKGNISVPANSYYAFNVSADLTIARAGVCQLAWQDIGWISSSYNAFDAIFPHISGVKIAASSFTLPAGSRFVLKAEVEDNA